MYNTNPYLGSTMSPSYNIQPTYTYSQQKTKIIRVNGENGARAYQLPPGSDALVLDETAPLVWLIQTDDAGYKTVTPYTIVPYEKEPEPNAKEIGERLADIDERLKKLEEALA